MTACDVIGDIVLMVVSFIAGFCVRMGSEAS